jgi:hypothetical protein
MKKKHNAFMEHYLVPGALFLFNICLVHMIYTFAAGSKYSLVSKVALTLAFALLASSLGFKKQLLLAGSILLYTLIVVFV